MRGNNVIANSDCFVAYYIHEALSNEGLSWIGYETSRPCPVSIAPHGRASRVPTHMFQPLLPRARQEESKSKF